MEMKKCNFCGGDIPINAQKCHHCKRWLNSKDIKDNDWHILSADYTSTLLFAWFLGMTGAHRFYTGHFATGLVQLLTFGGCGIWSYADLILISTNSFKDSKGRNLRDYNKTVATLSLVLAVLLPVITILLILLLIFIIIIAAIASGGN